MQLCLKPRGARRIEPETFRRRGQPLSCPPTTGLGCLCSLAVPGVCSFLRKTHVKFGVTATCHVLIRPPTTFDDGVSMQPCMFAGVCVHVCKLRVTPESRPAPPPEINLLHRHPDAVVNLFQRCPNPPSPYFSASGLCISSLRPTPLHPPSLGYTLGSCGTPSASFAVNTLPAPPCGCGDLFVCGGASIFALLYRAGLWALF